MISLHEESKHHYDIWQILKDLTSSQLRTLGCALGLSYSRLERMTQSDLPNEMIAAWLRREDDVPERSGQPTWNTLACKLKDIGQTGKSDDITQKWRQEHVSSANSSVQGTCMQTSSSIIMICIDNLALVY